MRARHILLVILIAWLVAGMVARNQPPTPVEQNVPGEVYCDPELYIDC